MSRMIQLDDVLFKVILRIVNGTPVTQAFRKHLSSDLPLNDNRGGYLYTRIKVLDSTLSH